MDEIRFGAAQQRRRTTLRRAGVAAAAGVGITLGAAGIAAAADNPSPSPSGGTTAQTAPNAPGARPHPGRMGHRGGPGAERGMGMRGAVHGEFVVPNGKGGWRTVQMQRGTVTAVSKTALTVRSEDGFTKSYVLTSATLVDAGRDGIATVATKEQVAVVATESGGTTTANEVRDLTKIKAERKQWGPPPGGGGMPGGPGGPGGG
jgi:hypothetical protein